MRTFVTGQTDGQTDGGYFKGPNTKCWSKKPISGHFWPFLSILGPFLQKKTILARPRPNPGPQFFFKNMLDSWVEHLQKISGQISPFLAICGHF